jgi:predicted NBD/HSP70 family sugar kinase
MPEITRRAAAGEKAALTTMERLVHYFGIAISTLVNILDPDCIVLGGGVSNLSILYTDGIEAAKKSVFNSSPVVKVVKNQLGDSAGVFGAAMLENWTNRQNGR